MLNFHIDNYYSQPRRYGDFELVQIGRWICSPDFSCKAHRQMDWFELTLVTGGRGTVYANGVGTSVRENDIFLSLPWDIHAIKSAKDTPLSFDFFTFRTSDAQLSAGLSRICTSCSNEHRILRDPAIMRLIGDAIAEVNVRDEYSETFLESTFRLVTIALIRDMRTGGKPAKSPSVRGARDLCYRVMHYIDGHIFTLRRLEELGKLCDYNYSYLSALFRRTTGQSIAQYYRMRRMSIAARMMSEEGISPTETAEKLGYASYFPFCRAFKETYSLSPREYLAKAIADRKE